jgi:hypothetical protein
LAFHNLGDIFTDPVFGGIAGVYFVAGELSRLGYIALTTTRNTTGIDIIASNEEFSKRAYIQVKTRQEQQKVWPIHMPKCKDVVYVFVKLRSKNERPEYYIVPNDYVVKRCKELKIKSVKDWLTRKYDHRRKSEYKALNFSIKPEDEEKYKGKWHQLGIN